MTLIRIRRGFDLTELSTIFGISGPHISRIFTTWVNMLSKYFQPLIEWPSYEKIIENMPTSFQKSFPSTRVIIDCSELYVQKPLSLDGQKATYSSYKSHNTFKFLLGIAPSGQVIFLSRLYAGSISDREIVLKSGFVEILSEGDNIMADRGFNIRDVLLKKDCHLNIPAFSGGKQLSTKAVEKSRKIASVRIHVERSMERLKNFKILQGVIPLKLKNSLDQILIICAALGNLYEPLVPE